MQSSVEPGPLFQEMQCLPHRRVEGGIAVLAWLVELHRLVDVPTLLTKLRERTPELSEDELVGAVAALGD